MDRCTAVHRRSRHTGPVHIEETWPALRRVSPAWRSAVPDAFPVRLPRPGTATVRCLCLEPCRRWQAPCRPPWRKRQSRPLASWGCGRCPAGRAAAFRPAAPRNQDRSTAFRQREYGFPSKYAPSPWPLPQCASSRPCAAALSGPRFAGRQTRLRGLCGTGTHVGWVRSRRRLGDCPAAP